MSQWAWQRLVGYVHSDSTGTASQEQPSQERESLTEDMVENIRGKGTSLESPLTKCWLLLQLKTFLYYLTYFKQRTEGTSLPISWSTQPPIRPENSIHDR